MDTVIVRRVGLGSYYGTIIWVLLRIVGLLQGKAMYQLTSW